MKVTITFSIDENLAERLTVAAYKNRCSRSALATRYIEEALCAQKQAPAKTKKPPQPRPAADPKKP